jgi:hypothetical protein
MKSREELINAILLHIEKTHNENDKKDLLMFSDAELLEIYEDIIEMNY